MKFAPTRRPTYSSATSYSSSFVNELPSSQHSYKGVRDLSAFFRTGALSESEAQEVSAISCEGSVAVGVGVVPVTNSSSSLFSSSSSNGGKAGSEHESGTETKSSAPAVTAVESTIPPQANSTIPSLHAIRSDIVKGRGLIRNLEAEYEQKTTNNQQLDASFLSSISGKSNYSRNARNSLGVRNRSSIDGLSRGSLGVNARGSMGRPTVSTLPDDERYRNALHLVQNSRESVMKAKVAALRNSTRSQRQAAAEIKQRVLQELERARRSEAQTIRMTASRNLREKNWNELCMQQQHRERAERLRLEKEEAKNRIAHYKAQKVQQIRNETKAWKREHMDAEIEDVLNKQIPLLEQEEMRQLERLRHSKMITQQLMQEMEGGSNRSLLDGSAISKPTVKYTFSKEVMQDMTPAEESILMGSIRGDPDKADESELIL